MINGADYMNWRDIVFGGGGGCLTTSAYESANIGSMTSTENLKLIAKDSAFQKKMKETCLLYTSPSPRDRQKSRMPSSA